MLFAIAALSCTADAAKFSKKARKADRIIKKHVKALGGTNNLKAIESVRVRGYLEQGGFEIPFTLLMKRPNRSRMEMGIGGRDIIQAYDGKTAWWVNPFTGAGEPEIMPDEIAESMLRWVDFDGPLVGYKKKRHRVEYADEIKLETGKAHKIKLTLAGGDVWHVFIDSESYLEVKRTFMQTYEGRTNEVSTYFSHFKEIEGFMTPTMVKGDGLDGSPYTMTFEKFEFNVDVDDAQFRMNN
jgi:outer membrane lipoprotein-sorting protein